MCDMHITALDIRDTWPVNDNTRTIGWKSCDVSHESHQDIK